MPTSSAAAGRPSSQLHYAVGEISGKLDQLTAALLPQLTELKQDQHDLRMRVDTFVPRTDIEAQFLSHDSRIKANESFRFQVLGGAGVVVFLISAWEVIRVFIPFAPHVLGH